MTCFELGCGEHRIMLTDRCGSPLLCEVSSSDVLEVEYTRLLDETSEARVTITTGGPGCCDCGALADGYGSLATWRHEVAIYRGVDLVWQGPIVRIEYGVEQVIITARDVSAWMERRTPTVDFSTVGAPVDLSSIAESLIRDAFDDDDPCVLDYLDVRDSGIVGEREYVADDAYVIEHLRELSETGVDWTVLGRRIVVAGEVAFSIAGTLTDDDFLGGLTVIEDGMGLATRAVITGDGVTGTAGGVDEFYGLVTLLTDSESVKDQASADAAAQQHVDASTPSPVFLTVPDDAALNPKAAVCINELVPGSLVTVRTGATCRTVVATLRLTRLRVFVSEGEESIGVTLVPIGAQVNS